ncbi:MAG: hypothetical protein ACKVS9_15075 [Phycisphaerae bacterium]
MLAGLCGFAHPVRADCGGSLLVLNHSFEKPVLADGGVSLNVVPDWTIIPPPVPFVLDLGIWNPPASAHNGTVPDGQQTAWSNRGTLVQFTNHRFELGYTYTLEVEVGDRTDTEFLGAIVAMSGPGGAGISSVTVSSVPEGGFATATVVITPEPGDLFIGQFIQIAVAPILNQTPNFQAAFDNVRLTRSVATNGGCLNRLVCDSIRSQADGGGDDYSSEQGARTFLPPGPNAQSRKTIQDYSGRTYVAGDGVPEFGGGPTYTVIRYADDGTLDETFPTQQSPYYLSLPNPLRTRRLVDVAVGPDDELYILSEIDNVDVEIVKFTSTGSVSTVIPNAAAGSIAVNGEYYLYSTFFDRGTGEHVTRREELDATSSDW